MQYLLLVASQTPAVVAWLAILLLLTAAYRAVGTGWLVLLWVPIYWAGLALLVPLVVLLTRALLPKGLRAGVCRRGADCRWSLLKLASSPRSAWGKQPLQLPLPVCASCSSIGSVL